MKSIYPILVLILCVLSCQPEDATPPNILIILADDLGYSDLGCYGGEIQTPNLNRLAENGLRYTQFSNTGRCWPTRASLLTGYYPQQIGRDKAPGIEGGGGGKRPDWAKLISAHLQKNGYRTYHSGKWHIDGLTIENGFHQSYAIYDQDRFFTPQRLSENDVQQPAITADQGFYSTTAIADKMIEYLTHHDQEISEQPFFAYLAFTAPHFPLQALQEDIDRIGTRYTAGWDSIRVQRWQRIKELGLVTNGELSNIEPQIGPPYHFPDALALLGEREIDHPIAWARLTEAQKDYQAAKMAIHAAMIERMDIEIGRVITQLEQMKTLENTIILFLSDNGASAEIMVRGDGHDETSPMGSAASYLCLGPPWSTVSNTPMRRHKTWVYEGGSSTPFIVHWPRKIKEKGGLRHTYGHIVDIVPTLMEVSQSNTQFQVPLPGQSLGPTFSQDIERGDPIWFYHEGNRALRKGDWKIVSAKDEEWGLYHIAEDRSEVHNLAEKYPDKVGELDREWNNILDDFKKVTPSKIEE